MRLIIILLFTTLLYAPYSAYSQTAEEQEMLDLVNELRQSRGLQPVKLNTALNQAAYNHSNDMAMNNYFSHTGLNGSSFSQRAIAAGYAGSPRGENIAAGNAGAEATFNQWKNSPGHLNNMLNSNVNEMGIGHAFNSNSTYRHYWTQIFGKGDATLSGDDLTDLKQLQIYPNPVKDKFKISFKNSLEPKLKVQLVSVTGQVVYKRFIDLNDKAATVDISDLQPGIYFLLTGKNIKAHKIIKI